MTYDHVMQKEKINQESGRFESEPGDPKDSKAGSRTATRGPAEGNSKLSRSAQPRCFAVALASS
jgi:hypothetical protein